MNNVNVVQSVVDLLPHLFLLVIFILAGFYILRWLKFKILKSNTKEIFLKSVDLKKFENLVDSGKLTKEEYMKIQMIIAKKLEKFEKEDLEKLENTNINKFKVK